MTPLLTRIDQQLAVCTDPLQQAELMAERACYLARIGEFVEANEIATSLRRMYGDGRSARVSVWVMLIEGLALFYEDLDIRSRDRVLRAHAISGAFNHDDLLLLTASWLAHIEFNRSDFVAMFEALRKCSTRSLSDASSWQVRVCLILADSFMYSRQTSVARVWYERARQSAIELGDQATLGAIIYNRAVLGLANLRLDALKDKPDTQLVNLLALEIDSAVNFCKGTGHQSLIRLLDLCRARVMILQREYLPAIAILERLIAQGDFVLNFGSDAVLLRIDLVECLCESGARSDAQRLFLEIDLLKYTSMTIDDQVIFVTLYMKYGGEMALISNGPQCEGLIETLQREYIINVSGVRAYLEDFSKYLNMR